MNDNLYGNLSWFNNAIMYEFLIHRVSTQINYQTIDKLEIKHSVKYVPLLVFYNLFITCFITFIAAYESRFCFTSYFDSQEAVKITILTMSMSEI